MRRALLAVALIAACRGEQRARQESGSAGSASGPAAASGSVVPKLPYSDDGDAVMRGLDAEIELAAKPKQEGAGFTSAPGDTKLVALLLERASIRGWLDDYQRALAIATTAVETRPTDPAALAMLGRAQLAVHAFADARTTIAKLPLGSRDELQASLDQATGNLDAALAARKARVDVFADALSVTLYAAALAEAGRAGEGIALIPTAVAHLRSNTPQYLGWLLFQWGLLYEQTGATAASRELYAEAHRRLPAHVEVIVHLAEALAATGDMKGARALVAVDADRHPSLLALAATMSSTEDRVTAATEAWERYLAVFPAAFADHAARFYLGAGNNSKRALELAKLNLATRDTPAARGLVIDAALAEGDKAGACAAVGTLTTAGPRRERFLAWRALAACGRAAEADQVARELGIQPR